MLVAESDTCTPVPVTAVSTSPPPGFRLVRLTVDLRPRARSCTMTKKRRNDSKPLEPSDAFIEVLSSTLARAKLSEESESATARTLRVTQRWEEGGHGVASSMPQAAAESYRAALMQSASARERVGEALERAVPLAVACLSRSTLAAVNASFRVCDRDNDEQLTESDFIPPILAAADAVEPEQYAKWAGLLAAADADSDGVVSKQEFVLAVLRHGLLNDEVLAAMMVEVNERLNIAVAKAAAEFTGVLVADSESADESTDEECKNE